MNSLDGKYVIGDETGILTEEDIGEPARVEVYESLDYAKTERDKQNRWFGEPYPYRVYQLKETGD